jgi:hypothetical protein
MNIFSTICACSSRNYVAGTTWVFDDGEVETLKQQESGVSDTGESNGTRSRAHSRSQILPVSGQSCGKIWVTVHNDGDDDGSGDGGARSGGNSRGVNWAMGKPIEEEKGNDLDDFLTEFESDVADVAGVVQQKLLVKEQRYIF